MLKLGLSEPLPDGLSGDVVSEIQKWIDLSVIQKGKAPKRSPRRREPVRPSLNREQLTPYVVRLLNEWVPVEVARLLIDQGEFGSDDGIPVLAIGTALERLLASEHLSQETLEMLVEPGWLSPEFVYPADIEILQDVVLSLLGRTCAPAPSVMPATSLCLSPESHLLEDYREALRHAFVVTRPAGEELHVPIASAQALKLLEDERVRIGSVVVTMDGRWWESENLQSGEQHCVVYRPAGRLQIDYSIDHARLRVPWPEKLLRWSGPRHIGNTFKIFGREWRATKWEVDSERTWLHLVFFRVLPISEIVPGGNTGPWHLRPASVDMAWAALESALASSLAQKSSEPVEQLRYSDLIPLGRSILGLAQSVKGWPPQSSETIETQIRGLRFLQSPLVSVYGRVPWRILPRPVRAAFLKVPNDPALLAILNEVIEGLPQALTPAANQPGGGAKTAPEAPSASSPTTAQ